MEALRIIPKKIIEEAKRLGGIDTGDYERSDEAPSYDKGGHKERSVSNQWNHIKHWKKDRRLTLVNQLKTS